MPRRPCHGCGMPLGGYMLPEYPGLCGPCGHAQQALEHIDRLATIDRAGELAIAVNEGGAVNPALAIELARYFVTLRAIRMAAGISGMMREPTQREGTANREDSDQATFEREAIATTRRLRREAKAQQRGRWVGGHDEVRPDGSPVDPPRLSPLERSAFGDAGSDMERKPAPVRRAKHAARAVRPAGPDVGNLHPGGEAAGAAPTD